MQTVRVLPNVQPRHGATCQHCYHGGVQAKATKVVEFHTSADKFFSAKTLRVPVCDTHAEPYGVMG